MGATTTQEMQFKMREVHLNFLMEVGLTAPYQVLSAPCFSPPTYSTCPTSAAPRRLLIHIVLEYKYARVHVSLQTCPQRHAKCALLLS